MHGKGNEIVYFIYITILYKQMSYLMLFGYKHIRWSSMIITFDLRQSNVSYE